MNWTSLRPFFCLDTRASFVAKSPRSRTLLDLGSSDGETLRHIAKVRPDLKLFTADKSRAPQKYPLPCRFLGADFERYTLPWPDGSMAAIPCRHLVEQLHELALLLREIARLLKPGARVYFETPHPKSLKLPSLRGQAVGHFTLNSYDASALVPLVTTESLAQRARQAGLQVETAGSSRNWLFAASHLFFIFLPPSRKKFSARVHWLGGSAYLIARRPQ
jgi:SAM-dependent methyltransferase